MRAIRSAHDGNAPLSPTIATRVVEEIAQGGGAPAEVDDLTPRERDVLVLIARGRSNKLIALELGVAEKTVKTHVSHIFAKLGLTDRTQAAPLRRPPRPRRETLAVLGPIPDGKRAVAGVASMACTPPSSPAPPAASDSLWPAPSPSEGGGS